MATVVPVMSGLRRARTSVVQPFSFFARECAGAFAAGDAGIIGGFFNSVGNALTKDGRDDIFGVQFFFGDE